MSGWERELSDDFLDEIEDADALVSGLPLGEAKPDDDVRATLLASAVGSRFERFATATAELLDVDEDTARQLLERIDDPSAWYVSALPVMSLIDLDGGPRVADAIRGFVRLAAGVHFPEHQHHGDEAVLIIQGSLEEVGTQRIYRAGDIARMPAGSTHSFIVRPGPDMVHLLVVQKGLSIAGQSYGPDDPRI
ncbi:MAG: cupin domain-containing protein [Sandaracinaceae bacterium]